MKREILVLKLKFKNYNHKQYQTMRYISRSPAKGFRAYKRSFEGIEEIWPFARGPIILKLVFMAQRTSVFDYFVPKEQKQLDKKYSAACCSVAFPRHRVGSIT